MMNITSSTITTVARRRPHAGRLMAVMLVSTTALAACGGTPTVAPPGAAGQAASPAPVVTATTVTTVAGTRAAANEPVLPVTENPIKNTSTNPSLKIDSVLVENNVDSSGKNASDHLEIRLSNTGTTELTGFEVFSTFTDVTNGITESYYTKLPDSFTIPAGSSRIAHFDNTGVPDHFLANEFSLYSTSRNALTVHVIVSATNAAIQSVTVNKDAGGTETAD